MAAHGLFRINRRGFAPEGKKNNEHGLTLIETMIAMLILMVALVSLAQVFGVAMVLNKNHGRDASKTTTFAHDKMEELTRLTFTRVPATKDTTSNLTVNPVNGVYPATGVGLTTGGSIPPVAAAAGYTDTLDINGARTTVAADIAFRRQWQIEEPVVGNVNLLRISVSVTSTRSFNVGTAPATVQVTLKASQ